MLSTSDFLHKNSFNSSLLYQLSEDERNMLKNCLLEMYSDIMLLCGKYNLCIMLSGGTALGAIRHNGFIPWDDDLDLMMPRADYSKFVNVFLNELGDKYDITVPDQKHPIKNLFLKVIKKNTKLVDLYDVANPYLKGVFVDIFPIDSVPNNILIRKTKGLLADMLAFISVSVLMFQYKSSILQKYMSVNFYSKLNYNFRLLVGFIFSFLSHMKWCYIFDRFVSSSVNSNYCTVPTGRKYYNGETLKSDYFFPVKEVSFEGRKAFVPNNINKYLANLYGDFMKLPAEDKRERHYYVDFDLN